MCAWICVCVSVCVEERERNLVKNLFYKIFIGVAIVALQCCINVYCTVKCSPGVKPRSPTLQADSLAAELPGKPNLVKNSA